MFWKSLVFTSCVVATVLIGPDRGLARENGDHLSGPGSQSEVETRASTSKSALRAVRPKQRERDLPATRWATQPGHVLWNRVALSALKTHARALVEMVPEDIQTWCPLYPDATAAQRRAFWLGFMSALAKYESTYRPEAVGGGGRWHGLLQILPATARGYECNAGTGAELRKGGANLSCAARIMAVTVPRDGVVYAPGGRGVAADWGPMRSRSKRADMAAWLKGQSYCMPVSATRPSLRPDRIAAD